MAIKINDKQTTTKGFAILSASSMINKLLALAYLPIQTMIVKDYGNGIIATGYTIYFFVYSLANAGIPAAISKLMSEQNAVGNYKGSQKIFKISSILLMVMGIFFSIAMAVGARWISQIVKQPEAYLMILTLSPALLFTSVSCSLRAYFQSRLNMIPSAISNVIEQLINSILTIVFAALLIKYGIDKAAAGTTLGTSVGAMGAVVLLFFMYRKNREKSLNEIENSTYEGPQVTYKSILMQIAGYSLPAILGIIALNLNNIIDLSFCTSRLLAGGFNSFQATELYGILTNKYQKILNLPLALTAALPSALIPAISSVAALKDKNILIRKINESYKAILLLTIPSAIGMAILAKPIITFVFFNLNKGSDLMVIGSWVIVLNAVIFIQNSVLIGIGKPQITPINMLIGMFVKLIINYFLIALPSINVKGAIIGTMSGYMISCILNQRSIRKYTGIKTHFFELTFKPVVASLIMGIVAFTTFEGINILLKSFIHSNILINDICVIISVILGAIVYLIALVSLKFVNSNDILKLPLGSKINKFLSIFMRSLG